MVWIDEIEPEKSIADLKTSCTITQAKLQTNYEVFDSYTRVVSRRSSTETAREESSFKKKLHRKTLSHGNVVVKVSDTDESVLDLNEMVKVESTNDKIQMFNSRWNETTVALKKQPYDEILYNLIDHQLQQSLQLKPLLSLLSLYIQETVQNGESRDYTRLFFNGDPILGTDTIARNMCLLVKDNLKSPPLALLQPRASRRA